MSKQPVSLFISYANKDDDYYRVFRQGLKNRLGMSRHFQWHYFDDQVLLPGDLWHEKIQEAAKRCDCTILLLSTEFLSSEYIKDHELSVFLKRCESDEKLLIVPILLAPCDFAVNEELEKRQVFKPKGKDYGHPERDRISFADLAYPFQNGSPSPNPNRERFLDDFVRVLEKTMQGFKPAAIQPQISAQHTVTLPAFLSPGDYTGQYIERIAPPRQEVDDLGKGYVEMRILTMELGRHSTESDVARASEMGNKLTGMLLTSIERMQERILDSEHLRRTYVDVHFDEIVYREQLAIPTLQMVARKRRHRSEFPWHERSLIASAFTLRLLRQIDEEAIYVLMDFVREKEERVWKKALTGIMVAILEHEEKIRRPEFKHLRQDIAALQTDPEVQEALLDLERHLSVRKFEKSVDEYKAKVNFDEKFEFFQKVQHWFQPFYEGNPVLEEKIADPELRSLLLRNIQWEPDALKYAFCYHYQSLDSEERNRAAARLRLDEWRIQNEYTEIKTLYPGCPPEEAVTRYREIQCYLKELYFFKQYFPREDFRHVLAQKATLYKSVLSEMLASEIVRDKITALSLYFADKCEEALPYFQRILAIEPNNFLFQGRYGRSLMLCGNIREAIAELEKALALQPDDVWTMAILAYCYVNYKNDQKDIDKCLSYLLEILERAPEYVVILKDIGWCYEEKKDYETALTYREKALDLDPDNAEGWGSLGYTLGLMGNYDLALEKRLESERLDPNLLWNLHGIAQCYEQKKEIDNVVAYYEKIIKLGIENAESWLYYGNFYVRSGNFESALEKYAEAERLNPKLILNLQNTAWCYEQKKEIEPALKYRQQVVELGPDNAENWGNLGFTIELSGNYELALEKRLEAERLDPKLVWNLRGIAQDHEQKKDVNKAVEYWEKAIQAEPENAETWAYYGNFYTRLGNFESALEKYAEAERLNPKLVWNLHGIAQCHEHKKEIDKAVEYWEKSLKIEPENAESWAYYGNFYTRLGNHDVALEKRLEAERFNPKLTWNLQNLAWTYEQTKNFEAALQYRKRIVELEPNNAIYFKDLAGTYLLIGSYEEAQAAFQKALAITPDKRDLHGSIGWAFFIAKHLDDAERNFVKAIELGAVTHTNPMNLGHICLIQKERKKALDYYQKAFAAAENTDNLMAGFEDDCQYLESHGISKEQYWKAINEAKAAAGK